MDNKIVVGIIGAVAIIVGWKLLRPSDSYRAQKNQDDLRQEQTGIQKIEKGNSTASITRSTTKARKMLHLESKLNMRRTPLVRSGGKLKIEIDFLSSIEIGCDMKDYDIIEGDLERTNTKTLNLTVESMGDEDFITSHRLNLADLKKGFTKNFLLPTTIKKGLFGVFLCSGKGPCLNKKPADMAKISEILFYDRRDGTYPKNDKIFQFQSFILGQDHLKWFDSSSSKQLRKSKSEYAKILADNGLKKSSATQIASLSRLHGKIESLPMSYSNNRVKIFLPRRENHCRDLMSDLQTARKHGRYSLLGLRS